MTCGANRAAAGVPRRGPPTRGAPLDRMPPSIRRARSATACAGPAPSNATSRCSSSARWPNPHALVESVAESVRHVPPFTLTLGGGGAFPNARRASVLWLGVREGSDALSELAGMIPREPDHVPYRAHLTLARVARGYGTRGRDARARDLRHLVTALDACTESDVDRRRRRALRERCTPTVGAHRTGALQARGRGTRARVRTQARRVS